MLCACVAFALRFRACANNPRPSSSLMAQLCAHNKYCHRYHPSDSRVVAFKMRARRPSKARGKLNSFQCRVRRRAQRCDCTVFFVCVPPFRCTQLHKAEIAQTYLMVSTTLSSPVGFFSHIYRACLMVKWVRGTICDISNGIFLFVYCPRKYSHYNMHTGGSSYAQHSPFMEGGLRGHSEVHYWQSVVHYIF